ncbi:MAG TPA: polysaccharide deacetylase family protein [Dehalococcoidia bacterium]|nr:polysaccharide deacetylase family protein [Dehalococcoidia bacterium]
MVLVAAVLAAGTLWGSWDTPPVALQVSAGCGRRPTIALTFDDGPNPPYTDRILRVLDVFHARATFFVAGVAVQRAPQDVRREVKSGMAVGTHSDLHAPDYANWSSRAFREDLYRAQRKIAAAAGFSPRLYRPPYGRASGTMRRVLGEEGMTIVGWDVDSRDWDRGTSSEAIVRNVVQSAHPGAIVLLHDGGLGGGNPDRTQTVEALPSIIQGLRRRGYTLVTVPEMTGLPERSGQQRNDVCVAR